MKTKKNKFNLVGYCFISLLQKYNNESKTLLSFEFVFLLSNGLLSCLLCCWTGHCLCLHENKNLKF